MSNVPVSVQSLLWVTDGLVWWGNRAISTIPNDPAEPDDLCCDGIVQQFDYQTESANCAIEQFFQSMAKLGGTWDFICKNPLIQTLQPGHMKLK